MVKIFQRDPTLNDQCSKNKNNEKFVIEGDQFFLKKENIHVSKSINGEDTHTYTCMHEDTHILLWSFTDIATVNGVLDLKHALFVWIKLDKLSLIL